ncbi:MAG: hypothetical protein GXY48_02635 [Methanomicrobiales archaeon]|nr:hypothetical protein [Methanomicrobiales archaeon]
MDRDNNKDLNKFEISQPLLLIVEGSDEIYFFNAFFKYLKESSPDEWQDLEKIQIISTDSKDKLKPFLEILPDLPNINSVKKIAIIQDADNCDILTFETIQNHLHDAHLPVPEKQIIPKEGIINNFQKIIVQVLIISLGENGMLEDLCMDSVIDDPVMPCVDSYFQCLENILGKFSLSRPKNLAKSKVRVFIASKKECTAHVGYAAQEGYWNFEKSSFDRIRIMLKNFISN